MPSPFLTAEWRWLAMLNYEVDPAVLAPFVPAGTELDAWRGKTYISLVGFLFLHTRLRGVAVPFHTNFQEVNLRFYVRRTVGGERRRGVVFIKELVPRRAIAWTARWLYHENYVAVPMKHRRQRYGASRRIVYGWTLAHRPHRMEVRIEGEPHVPEGKSLEAFITEHYWGYNCGAFGATLEYQVEHPAWRVWPAHGAHFAGDVAALYGERFVPFLTPEPASALVAEGSRVSVFRGKRIGHQEKA